MTDIIAMHSAEPVIFGVVKIVWKAGFSGIVDLRPLLAKGEMFEFLRVDPTRFDDLRLEEQATRSFGSTITETRSISDQTPCVSAPSVKPVSFTSQAE
jgi:hypothetical protein